MELVRRLIRRPGVAIACVTLLAGVLRLWSLGHPPERVFDEAYYPKSACWLLGWSDERCGIEDDLLYDWVHPPLGKYAIALGELAFGFDASDGLSTRDTLSFRLPSAIAGTLSVAALALSAQLLFGSVGSTWLAGTLLAVEGLSVVHSRVGMLDIFVTFWILLAFVFLLLDRRWADIRTGTDVIGSAAHIRVRPWRLATGIALGAAFATKWSGLMALAAIVFIGLWWDATRRRAAERPRWLRDTLLHEAPGVLLSFIVVPLLIYIAAYGAYFLSPGATFGRFVEGNLSMARFHANMVAGDEGCGSTSSSSSSAIGTYDSSGCGEDITSRPLDWLLLTRPIPYWENPTPARALILANGNAGIFWGAFASVPFALFLAVRRRDRAAAAIVAMVLTLYLPWFAVRRVQYFFYAVPIVPFLVLAFVLLVRQLRERGWPALASGLAIYAILLGVIFWPVYAGIPLPEVAWKVLRPFFPLWWGGV